MMDINLTSIGKHFLAVFRSKLNVNTWRFFIVLVYDQHLNKLYTIDLDNDTCHVLGPMAGLRINGYALLSKLDLNDSGMVSCNIGTKDVEEFVMEIA